MLGFGFGNISCSAFLKRTSDEQRLQPRADTSVTNSNRSTAGRHVSSRSSSGPGPVAREIEPPWTMRASSRPRTVVLARKGTRVCQGNCPD